MACESLIELKMQVWECISIVYLKAPWNGLRRQVHLSLKSSLSLNKFLTYEKINLFVCTGGDFGRGVCPDRFLWKLQSCRSGNCLSESVYTGFYHVCQTGEIL